MAKEELTSNSKVAANNYMPLGQPGAHGSDPNGDAAWLAGQAAATTGLPTHLDQSYEGMSKNPPGVAINKPPYEEYKHKGM